MIIDKRYEPKEVEGEIYDFWLKNSYFKGKIVKGKKPFVVVIPPPNVTGSLHMGHALNNTLQDILVRQNRMKGVPTLWVPGTDHAGIATQNVVEKQLAKEGKNRHELGRAEFVKKVWEWVDEYGDIIIKQLKKLGCSCDWSRQRFTLDEDYSAAVQKAFEHYYKKGWIYQGERVINWCVRCQTALSDIELEHKEVEGSLWFVRYPLKLKTKNEKLKTKYITVATTRPETMLGDTAVAVHPKDKRYKNVVGKILILPLMGREIPVVAFDAVDKEFGTGAVKVTPAHDPNDFEIGKIHNLAKIKVIDELGKMTKEAGKYAGQKTQQARENILQDLQQKGLLLKTQKYVHQVPHCYRCGKIVEQLVSKQWFVNMQQLAQPAIEAVKNGKIKFEPKRWEKVYLDWMENLKDWCISRQIWWGHRLPVWQSKVKIKNEKLKIYVGGNPPKGYTQIDDVLDTWFSSALWPIAVFLKKNSSSEKLKSQNAKLKRVLDIFGEDLITDDLEYFYPTTVLSTARDILYLWVARMIFSGLEFMKEVPFTTVYIHPTVLNAEGKRMSKSLGTGLDPIELIEKYGADATRFGLAFQTTGTQDLRFSENKIVASRNFANKIWNASRFVMMQIANSKLQLKSQKGLKPNSPADRVILEQLNQTIYLVNQNLDKFRFGQAAEQLFQFFWHQFCDIYLEQSKKQLEGKKLRGNTQQILVFTLVNSLKLLHPFMPFVTEAVWQNLKKTVSLEPALISSCWPHSAEATRGKPKASSKN